MNICVCFSIFHPDSPNYYMICGAKAFRGEIRKGCASTSGGGSQHFQEVRPAKWVCVIDLLILQKGRSKSFVKDIIYCKSSFLMLFWYQIFSFAQAWRRLPLLLKYIFYLLLFQRNHFAAAETIKRITCSVPEVFCVLFFWEASSPVFMKAN